jgi:4'-phosphopantetheinyl transferase
MDALRCLAAEALLRHALGERHGLGAGQWEVAIGPHGKPFLTGQPGIHFNLSHAGPWVACAVHDAPVGIDVEAAQAMDPLPAASIMAAGELSHFRQLPAQAGQDYFYRLWTLKESLVKALGVGLSLDPRSITLRLEPQPITASHASLALGGLTLRELPLPEGHRAALCY